MTKWQSIYGPNKKTIGKNPNLIKPGQKLTMPDGSIHVVKKGENLTRIANGYGKAKAKPKPAAAPAPMRPVKQERPRGPASTGFKPPTPRGPRPGRPTRDSLPLPKPQPKPRPGRPTRDSLPLPKPTSPRPRPSRADLPRPVVPATTPRPARPSTGSIRAHMPTTKPKRPGKPPGWRY